VRLRGPKVLDLSERDRAVLVAVDAHALLTSSQIERLLFTDRHSSVVATRRRCQAVLRRLVDVELIDRLHRRQGGHRAGSTGFTYRLTSKGRRAIGQPGRGARDEPSERQTLHVLACAELSVQLAEAERRDVLASLTITHEPNTWRRFVGPHGGTEILKPDLLIELVTTDGWELRWFVEVDRATEHLPTVIRKCTQYQRYWQSGAEPHPIFPRVLWSVPDERRAAAIDAAIERTGGLTDDLFRVATTEQTVQVLRGNNINETNEGGEL
jgi:hypothetical protein